MDNQKYIKLVELAKNAYAPYSKFTVACIIDLKGNKDVVGVNVENASYPAGICAERVALGQLCAQGYRRTDIMGIYLYAPSKTVTTPCGICRQMLCELVNEEINLHMFNVAGTQTIMQIKELLPNSFSSTQLNEK